MTMEEDSTHHDDEQEIGQSISEALLLDDEQQHNNDVIIPHQTQPPSTNNEMTQSTHTHVNDNNNPSNNNNPHDESHHDILETTTQTTSPDAPPLLLHDNDNFSRRIREQLAPVVCHLTQDYLRAKHSIVIRYDEQAALSSQTVTRLQKTNDKLTTKLHHLQTENNNFKTIIETQQRLAIQSRIKSRSKQTATNVLCKLYNNIVVGRWNVEGRFLDWASQLRRYLTEWIRFGMQERMRRDGDAREARFETVAREIVSRYEVELEKLRSGLSHAYREIARVHVQRQQIEERMRRTFLQGMTAMNLETLHFFNGVAVGGQSEDKNTILVADDSTSGGGGGGYSHVCSSSSSSLLQSPPHREL